MVSNADRAFWAEAGLNAYLASHQTDDDMQTGIKDLITDLLHLARRECNIESAVEFAKLAAEMHDMEFEEDSED